MDRELEQFLDYADYVWTLAGGYPPGARASCSCILPSLLVRAYFDGNLEEAVRRIVEENEQWQVLRQSNTSNRTS